MHNHVLHLFILIFWLKFIPYINTHTHKITLFGDNFSIVNVYKSEYIKKFI